LSIEINFFSVFFEVESEYGISLSLTITIFALEGEAIIFLTLYIFKFLNFNEKYNSRAKNHCNRKIALLSILIKLNSFGTKKSFLVPPTQKSCSFEIYVYFLINFSKALIESGLKQTQTLSVFLILKVF
jgi:hypothetical protein